MQGDESPVSVTYQVNGFDEVLEVAAQLTEQGIVPYYSCKTGGKFERDLVQLQTMFILVSIFIVVIAPLPSVEVTDEAGSYALGVK